MNKIKYKVTKDSEGNQIVWTYGYKDLYAEINHYSCLGSLGERMVKEGNEYKVILQSRTSTTKFFRTFEQAQNYVEEWFKRLIEKREGEK